MKFLFSGLKIRLFSQFGKHSLSETAACGAVSKRPDLVKRLFYVIVGGTVFILGGLIFAAETKIVNNDKNIVVNRTSDKNNVKTKKTKEADHPKALIESRKSADKLKIKQSGEPKFSVYEEQARADEKEDRYVLAFEGSKPNQWLVCDTVVRRLPDGRLAYFFLAGGTKEPSAENYTAVMFSGDDGATWSEARAVDVGFPRSGKTVGQGPTEFLTIKGGKTVLLFFATHSNTWNTDWQSWSIESDDNCRTWSAPKPLPGRLANATFIRPAIRTSDGRLMIPCQHYLDPARIADSRNSVLVSNDDGKTWKEYGNIRCPLKPEVHLWAEPTIVELSENHIVMLIRPQWGGGTTLFRADSFDGGETWPDVAEKTEIPNPSSKATLLSLGENRVALIHNPNPNHRSPLALWISFDGMKTWPYKRVLVKESCDGPKGNINYPEGFVSVDRKWIYLAFDNNRHQAVFMKVKLPEKLIDRASLKPLSDLSAKNPHNPSVFVNMTDGNIRKTEDLNSVKSKQNEIKPEIISGERKASEMKKEDPVAEMKNIKKYLSEGRQKLADQIRYKGFSKKRLEVMKEFILPALVRMETMIKDLDCIKKIPTVPLSAMLTPNRSPDIIYRHYLDTDRIYFNVIWLKNGSEAAKLELLLDNGLKMEFPTRSSDQTELVRRQSIYVLAEKNRSYVPAGLPDTMDELFFVPDDFPFDIDKIKALNPRFSIHFKDGSRTKPIPVWCQEN